MVNEATLGGLGHVPVTGTRPKPSTDSAHSTPAALNGTQHPSPCAVTVLSIHVANADYL